MPVRIEKIDPTAPPDSILRRAAKLLREGRVIVCPTDTGYAFAANALDEAAIKRVFDLKGRSFNNPIHVAVTSMEEAEKYAQVNDNARRLASKFLPGGLTLVMKRKESIPDLLVAGLDTIGIRIPDNRTILALCKMTVFPLTTTSANISGKPSPFAVKEIIEQLGAAAETVGIYLDQGEITPHEVSTIVDVTVDPPKMLRAGKIAWEEIVLALKESR
jgi:L-threonylcarbamoyladenylate synthase